MLRRFWQAAMIALARSEPIKRHMQRWRAASGLARRYVGGADVEDGVARAGRLLTEDGIRSSLFFLGEYVDTPALVAENVANKRAIAVRLGAAGYDVHVSVDPTQIGHSIDPELARDNAFGIAQTISEASNRRPGLHGLMLDMEDASVIDATIALHDELAAAGLPAALTLQAYLRRTEADLKAKIEQGAKVRLVKGAFAAGRDIAFTGRAEIKANFRRLIDLMLSEEAKASGFHPIIATHDDRLQAHAITRAEAAGWRADQFEFEMLLGVRPDVARDLAGRGYGVRLYVPFGSDWWPYAVRRIGENPANALLLARSALAGG